MSRDEVTCDLDGVIVDCLHPSLRLVGRDDLADDPTYPPTYNWSAETGISNDEFWQRVEDAGHEWWENLPFTSFGKQLLDYLLNESGLYVEIGTKVVGPNGAKGKWNWAMKHLPEGVPLHMTTNKERLGAPGRLLIDDSEHNVELWRKTGGDAILVPATYNPTKIYLDDPFFYIKSEMVRLGYVR